MYFVTLFLLISPIFAEVIPEDYSPNCYLEGLTEFKWQYGYVNPNSIEDVYDGVIKSFGAENVRSLEVIDGKYMDVVLKNDEVVIITNDKFKEFEKDTPTTYNTPRIVLEIRFYCEKGERELTFIQTVVDTNNHKPVFSQDEYIFRFAMSVPNNFFVTDFYQIRAMDLDVSYNSLSFNFEENEYLKVVGRVGNGKNYYPSIKTTKPIELPFRKSFVLETVDSGSPPLTSSANVTLLLIKPENIIPTPIFNKPFYIAHYDRKRDILKLDTISLKQGSVDYEVIQKNFLDYIQVKFVEGQIKVDLIKKFPDDIKSKSYVIVNIELRHDFAFQKGKTSILIRFV